MPLRRAWVLLLAGCLLYLGSPFVSRALDLIDEGRELTHAAFMTQGLWPYRDFWAVHPPGLYVLLAGLFRLFGPSMVVGRLLFEVTIIGIVFASFWILDEWTRRRPLALAGALFVLCWQGWFWPAPAVGQTGQLWLLVALGGLVRAIATQQRRWMLLAGAATVLTLSFRHDFGGQLLAATLLSVAWGAVLRRRRPTAAAFPPGAAGTYLAGIALTGIPLATLLIQAVPWRLMARDLIGDLFGYYVQLLPASSPPPLADLRALLAGALHFPTFLLESYTRVVIWYLPLLGVAGSAVWVIRRVRRGPWDVQDQQGLCILLTAVALLPVGLIRGDWGHRIWNVPSFLIMVGLLGLVLARGSHRAATAFRLIALVVLALAPLPRLLHPPWAGPVYPLTLERARGIAVRDARGAQAVEATVRAIQRVTAPGEPIYVATQFHGRIFAAWEAGLYFLSDRPAGARYEGMPLFHGEAVQRTIIEGLEAHAVNLLVLRTWDADELRQAECPAIAEALAAAPAAPLLDAYVAQRFAPVQQFGPFTLYRRAEGPPSAARTQGAVSRSPSASAIRVANPAAVRAFRALTAA